VVTPAAAAAAAAAAGGPAAAGATPAAGPKDWVGLASLPAATQKSLVEVLGKLRTKVRDAMVERDSGAEPHLRETVCGGGGRGGWEQARDETRVRAMDRTREMSSTTSNKMRVDFSAGKMAKAAKRTRQSIEGTLRHFQPNP
jgi:hypothetical protein